MKHKADYEHASYMHDYVRVDQLRWKLREAGKLLREYEFDSIAFRGMSGALVASILALRLNKRLLMVRKPNDRRHSDHLVEGDKSAKRYIIVDDFIESGKTVRAIETALKKFAPKAKCLGVFELRDVQKQNADYAPQLKPVPQEPPNYV